jgi:hypothetical protein
LRQTCHNGPVYFAHVLFSAEFVSFVMIAKRPKNDSVKKRAIGRAKTPNDRENA